MYVCMNDSMNERINELIFCTFAMVLVTVFVYLLHTDAS